MLLDFRVFLQPKGCAPMASRVLVRSGTVEMRPCCRAASLRFAAQAILSSKPSPPGGLIANLHPADELAYILDAVLLQVLT